jgi:DNA polymerase III subunit delta'
MAIGHDTEPSPAVRLLQRSLERGRVAHAYLFSGDSLPDLEELARALVKALNCPSSSPVAAGGLRFCGQCASCRRIDEFNHPDILWIRPESKLRLIKIEQIRDVMHAVNLKPTEAAWKAAILVAAERMKVEAASAFLKTLEEPPPRSLLILLSTEPQRLLDTIRSRCLRLTVGADTTRVDDRADREWLTRFSATVAAPQKSLLSRYRLLDGLLTRLADIRAAIERDLSARSPLEAHDDVDPELRDRWEEELNAAIEAEYRKQRSSLLNALHWWLRDVWIASLIDGARPWRMPEFSVDAEALARRLTPPQALENLRILERTRRLLETNVQEALALEVGLIKLNL